MSSFMRTFSPSLTPHKTHLPFFPYLFQTLLPIHFLPFHHQKFHYHYIPIRHHTPPLPTTLLAHHLTNILLLHLLVLFVNATHHPTSKIMSQILRLPNNQLHHQKIPRFSKRSGKMMRGAQVQLKGWQRAAVAIGSALGALMDPRRADLVAALGETTGKTAFETVLERMRKDPEGREVLLEQPRVISERVSHAWDLPEGTFGAAYAKFMGSRNFSPDDRPPVRFMETEELAYVAMRAREVHDFWHVLFSLPTNLIGESALKVVEFEQMLLPMCMLSVVGGSARFNGKQRALFFQHYFPWAIHAGLRCTDLMCIYYEKHFHENLEDVQQKWGIIPCPAPKLAAGQK